MSAVPSPRKQQGINDKSLVAGFLLALTVFVASAVLSILSGQNFLNESAGFDHSHQVLESIYSTYSNLSQVESAARGYVINADEDTESEYQSDRVALSRSIQTLVDLTQLDPLQSQRVRKVRDLIGVRTDELNHAMSLRRSGGIAAVINNPQRAVNKAVRVRLLAILTEIQNREVSQIRFQKERVDTSILLEQIGDWTCGVIGLAALTGIFLLARRLVTTLRFYRVAEASRAADLEERVRERTFELSAAIRDLEAFSYSVSHDLRAPLRAMSGYAGILLKDLGSRLDASDVRLLQRMQINCVKMSGLIDALLALFRVAKTELSIEEIDLSSLALEVIEELRGDFADTVSAVTVERGMRVIGDRSMVRILLVNLIGNAMKFSSKKPSPAIKVGVERRSDENVFFVQDNGAGFDQSQSGLLFEPFQRLHTEQEFAGTGVGLAMCRKIIVRHRGEIWLESRLEEGTTVFFTVGIRPLRDSQNPFASRANAL